MRSLEVTPRCLAAAIMTAGVLLLPPAPARAAEADGAHVREVEAWRGERVAGLRQSDSWLTLAGLVWLREGDSVCGGDPASDVVLPGDGVPARAGVFHLRDGTARFVAEPGAGVTHGGEPFERLVLHNDTEGDPTILELGSLSFHVIERGGRSAVRIKDRRHPALAAFRGLDFFPVRGEFRVEGHFEPYDASHTIPIPTVLGTVDDQPSPGAVVFEMDGSVHRLDALAGAGDGDLFFVFGDATNARTSYGGGRFLNARVGSGGTVVLDFNRAYNPPCAFTPYATCPLPPRQNRLDSAVEAGEKTYSGGHP